MDKLAAYDSDSESETGENASSDDHHVQVSKDCEETVSSGDCLEHTSEKCDSNFFGFTSHTSQMTRYYEKEEKEKQAHVTRHVNIDGISIEVPEGDFWTDFSEVEIAPDDLKEDHGKGQKRKFVDPIFMEKPSQSFNAKRQHQDRNTSMHRYTNCTTHTAASSTSSRYYISKNNSQKPGFSQSDPKVKVYEVHPKISPHLNRHQSNHCACKISHRWAGHAGVINRIAWCSNPSFSHLIASASMDSTVRVWNAWGQQEPCVRTLTTHTKAVRDVQWSSDGRRILSSSYDRTAAVTDVQTGQCQVQFEHSGFVSVGRFHPVTPHLVTTGTNDCIQVWDIRDPQVPVRILTHKEQMGQIQDLMFSHDGRELFSCGDVVTRESADRSIMAWDFHSGVVLSNQIFQERYTVTRLCLHPSQSQFLAQTQAGYVAIFSTQRPFKMNKNKRFEGHKTASYNIGVSQSQDGSIVYSGSSDGKLYCYSFNTGKRIRTLDCGGVLLDVAAHPVLPSVVAGATWDGDIALFQ